MTEESPFGRTPSKGVQQPVGFEPPIGYGKFIQPTRVVLYGNPELANKHVGIAKAILGDLYNRDVRLGGNQIATVERKLPNGVIIRARWDRGMPRIDIYEDGGGRRRQLRLWEFYLQWRDHYFDSQTDLKNFYNLNSTDDTIFYRFAQIPTEDNYIYEVYDGTPYYIYTTGPPVIDGIISEPGQYCSNLTTQESTITLCRQVKENPYAEDSFRITVPYSGHQIFTGVRTHSYIYVLTDEFRERIEDSEAYYEGRRVIHIYSHSGVYAGYSAAITAWTVFESPGQTFIRPAVNIATTGDGIITLGATTVRKRRYNGSTLETVWTTERNLSSVTSFANAEYVFVLSEFELFNWGWSRVLYKYDVKTGAELGKAPVVFRPDGSFSRLGVTANQHLVLAYGYNPAVNHDFDRDAYEVIGYNIDTLQEVDRKNVSQINNILGISTAQQKVTARGLFYADTYGIFREGPEVIEEETDDD